MNAHEMSPFFANYGYHPETEWRRERQAQNPGAELYSHWMKAIHKRAVQALNYTREGMKKYYDQKALQQPDYKECDLLMLNGKNIHTKRPSKKLSPKLYGPFKIIEARKQGDNALSNLKYRLHGGSTEPSIFRCWNPIEPPSKKGENSLYESQKRSMVISSGKWKRL